MTRSQLTHQAYVLTGVLADGRTLELDETLPVPNGRVRVTIEALVEKPSMTHDEYLAWLSQRQQQRNYVAPSREDVDEYLRTERESWDE